MQGEGKGQKEGDDSKVVGQAFYLCQVLTTVLSQTLSEGVWNAREGYAHFWGEAYIHCLQDRERPSVLKTHFTLFV